MALEQRLQRVPTEEEIAAELGIGHKEYQEWLLELRGISIGSLDAPLKEGDSRTLMHYGCGSGRGIRRRGCWNGRNSKS